MLFYNLHLATYSQLMTRPIISGANGSGYSLSSRSTKEGTLLLAVRRSHDAPVGPSCRRQHRSHQCANANNRGALHPPPNASETARVKRQLSLFPSHPTLPSWPFARSHWKLDELHICARCGREIVARRNTVDGGVLSEFVSDDAPARSANARPIDNCRALTR